MTDFDKAGREYMEQKSPDKLFGRNGHDFFLIAIGVVPPAEGNLAVFKPDQTLIADSYAVGIAA